MLLRKLANVDKRIKSANVEFTSAVRVAVAGEAPKPAGSSTDPELP